MESKKRSTPEIWKALSNKIRRDLLCFIGEKQIVSFTEIQEQFQMKVGTLYHHIDTLGELISQNHTKKYLLTEKGRRAFSLIEDELDVSAPSLQAYGRFSFLHNFFLRPVFRFINNDAVRSLGFSIMIFIGLTVATYFLSVTPIFLFPSFITPAYFAPVYFVISTVITYIITELVIVLIFRKTSNKLALFQSIIIAQIPLILLCILESFVFKSEYPTSFLQIDIWFIAILIIVQLIFVGLLIEAIIVIKELRIEKAGSAALLTVFIVNSLAFLIMNMLEVLI